MHEDHNDAFVLIFVAAHSTTAFTKINLVH
jgi:hypothetical protein